ncbi:hypothetical protein ACH5RR_029579 [Cinchona calisaya]|uniref:Uncharacterized protein n=1 Tax=Cinchona calisaya TaxID=153742 RepID=A0ABD2YS62_9GENT
MWMNLHSFMELVHHCGGLQQVGLVEETQVAGSIVLRIGIRYPMRDAASLLANLVWRQMAGSKDKALQNRSTLNRIGDSSFWYTLAGEWLSSRRLNLESLCHGVWGDSHPSINSSTIAPNLVVCFKY